MCLELGPDRLYKFFPIDTTTVRTLDQCIVVNIEKKYRIIVKLKADKVLSAFARKTVYFKLFFRLCACVYKFIKKTLTCPTSEMWPSCLNVQCDCCFIKCIVCLKWLFHSVLGFFLSIYASNKRGQ